MVETEIGGDTKPGGGEPAAAAFFVAGFFAKKPFRDAARDSRPQRVTIPSMI
jgi:hypothetical protein